MESIIERLTQLPPNLMQSIGIIVIFLAVVCEPIPPLFVMIPGQKLLIVAGFLSKIGLFPLPMLLIYAVLGTWMGDIFSYFTGRKYGLPLLKKYGKYVMISDETLEKINTVLKKNLGIGTILLKFGLTRGLVPFMAGSLKMNFKKIFIYTGISSLLRAVACVLLGYILGASYEIMATYMGKIITRGIIIAIGVIALFAYFKSEYNIFKKSFTLVVIGNVLSIVGFSVITQKLLTHQEIFTNFDLWVQSFFERNPFIDQIMLWVTQIFDFWFIGLIGLILIVFLYRKKAFYHLIVFMSSTISVVVLFPLIKTVVQRVRPETALVALKDYSFPSGHAATAIVVCLGIRYVLDPHIKNKRLKYLLLLGMITSTLFIGASRLFMHVHRFTDVIGGFLLGFFILTSAILIRRIVFNYHLEHKKIVRQRSRKQIIDILLNNFS